MSKPIDDGGYAFAAASCGDFNNGMTLRQHYAGLAMQAICSHPDTWGLEVYEIVAKAFEISDRLIAAGKEEG